MDEHVDDGQILILRRLPVIRSVRHDDAAGVHAIYAPIVRDTVSCFEYAVPDVAEMEARIARIRASGYPWLVADDDGVVVGYACAGPFRNRTAYDWTCEVSVYIHDDQRGRGVGGLLYERLFTVLRAQGFRAAVAGAIWPNAASAALLRRFSCREIGIFPGVG